MRYNDRVEILNKKSEVYDPETGEYTTGEDERLVLPAYVMDLGLNKQVAVFGAYKRDSKVVYLQNKSDLFEGIPGLKALCYEW